MPFIVYAPLSGFISQCEDEDVQMLHSVLSGEKVAPPEYSEIIELLGTQQEETQLLKKHPGEYKKISILSNYKCNLSCVYCYSAKGRSTQEIRPVYVRAAIDYLINNASQGENLSLFFSGGGEPLLSWKIIKPIIEDSISKSIAKRLDIKIHFMSNGTVYTQEIADFLKEKEISLCVSFEILSELQNNIRGQYERVSENIKKYLTNGNTIYISSTITPLSVGRLPEMVEEIAKLYPGITTVTMEPVTGTELFEIPEKMASFYDEFDWKYKEAERIAQEHNISLNTSTKNITDNFVERYCPGKLCLTPNGTFTICHCASSQLEERYDKCTYGHIDEEGGIHFDIEKFNGLISINHSSYDECENCFAKVHCGGECMTRRDTYPKEYMKVVCNRTKRLVFEDLLNTLNKD